MEKLTTAQVQNEHAYRHQKDEDHHDGAVNNVQRIEQDGQDHCHPTACGKTVLSTVTFTHKGDEQHYKGRT